MASSKRDRTTTWSSGEGTFDHRLSGLTPRQSQRVRDLTRQVLAERGIEAIVHADRLETADKRVFGLANLASKCLNSELAEDGWLQVVTAHIDGILAAFGAVPPELTAAEMRAGAYLRLVHSEAVPGKADDAFRYARRIGGGFIEMIAHRNGDHVRWLRDEDVAKVGANELREIGRENLSGIHPDECQTLRNGNGCIYIARGDSGFVASKLLQLPEVIAAVPGANVSYPEGVLVAVPNRYELAFAPLDANVVANLAGLVSCATHQFTYGIAPLTPHVYWWREGKLTQITEVDRTGFMGLADVPDFIEVVDRLRPNADAA